MNEIQDGRVPPHDLDAEAAVLSAVLVDVSALDKVLEFLKPAHFYSEAHRRIFEAAVELHSVSQPVDVLTVGAWLKSRERIAQVGGMAYLTEVLNAAPAVANVAAYGRILVEKWRIRQLIAACQRTAAHGYTDYGDPQNFLTAHAETAHVLAYEESSTSLVKLIDAMKESLKTLSRAMASGGISGRRTGFDRYDRMTAGLHDGDLTIIAARPGMGKTAFVLNVAANVAQPIFHKETGSTPAWQELTGVVFFSLEMPREQIANRMVCSTGRVDLGKFRSGMIGPSDFTNLHQANAYLGTLDIWIDDAPALSILDLRAKLRKKQAEYDTKDLTAPIRRKVGLVVVDYLQLMKGREGAQSREQEISEISRGLKQIAKELKLPVIALSQLNRAVENRSEKSKRPQLGDLRESGAIEQDADNVAFIYRDDYYNKDSAEKNIAEIIIAKQRNGPTGTAKVRFDREYTRFDNLAEGECTDED